jgi:exodeoxyribonuclease V alpha subunit
MTLNGKITKVIYQGESGYSVFLFRVKEIADENEADKTKISGKSITAVGNIFDLRLGALLELTGEFEENAKYGKEQFSFKKYCYIKPNTKESVYEFLVSFVEGCGEATAKKIVDKFGDDALNIIKENKENLELIDGITPDRINRIYRSILNFDKNDEVILRMQEMGFSVEESSRIFQKYKDDSEYILDNEFYEIKSVIDFPKVDNVYVRNHDPYSEDRIFACTLQALEDNAFQTGNTYSTKEELYNCLAVMYNIKLGEEELTDIIDILLQNNKIVIEESRIYLVEYYEAEISIAKNLRIISNNKIKDLKNVDEKIEVLEQALGIEYDELQKKAIKEAIRSNVSIVSGGPGTGKTTIINAIVRLYIDAFKLSPTDIAENIALIAPTGRASKKMSQSTGLPASTIHRYLKWHKETDEFIYNEYNKTMQKLVIVDEASMVDILLFNSLLKALSKGVRLVLVGDSFQLPSVGPGLVLNDLIKTDLFTYIPLTRIYRQSENSYIPYLAKEIKECDLQEEYLDKKDDYNFIRCDSKSVHKKIEDIINIAKRKNIDESSLQVLVPIYKGDNGIDNLNKILQEIYNPARDERDELIIGDVTYREGDKVLQLVNDPDNNVYNGDIGYIEGISILTKPRKKEIVSINFDGNVVDYDRKTLINIKHAYAMSVHKSQGSEFDHVVMPICKEFFYMLYNKLIYTAVSRAKKSLILVGDASVFYQGVLNRYSSERKTTLKERLEKEFV